MKTYKINYKLQSVSSATKPIQLVCALNTKWEGKYLYQLCSVGVSVLPEEWDANRNLPKKAELAGRLLKVKEDVENTLNSSAASIIDETVHELYLKGFFKQVIEESIKKNIHEVVTPIAEYMNKNFRWHEMQREDVYNEVRDKIKASHYSLVDAYNNKINLDWFFDLDLESEAKQFIQPTLQLAPVSIINNEQSTSSIESCLIHDVDVKKYGSMKYIELVDFVKNRKIKTGTLSYGRAYNVLINVFNEFDEQMTVNELTDDVFLSFFDYLLEERDVDLAGYNNYKKWINAVFAFATSQLTMQFNSKKLNIYSNIFDRTYEKVKRPYLTEDMLAQLLDLKFDDSHKHLDYVRDLFYIQSYTSVTYVDLPQLLKKAKVKTVAGDHIRYSPIRRKKTGVEADIVLFDEVHNILEKYNFNFSKISNAYYNRSIKDTLKLAGFTDDFTQERYNTRTKNSTYKTAPFYTFIGSHTGRRSYVTNMKIRGISDEAIMNQSQHTSKQAFDMYFQDSKTINFENFVRELKVNKK
ncbi:MAG: phage integrase SAM-like domain-containing protein [Nitrosopumilus sp.]|nr:phage integrase SAM-like domain-containing protein [Nitrosopumilus sp.]